MAKTTGIAWCDSTFNCWIGCSKIGPGCDNCYAEALDSRKRWGGTTHWGAGVPRYRTSASNWAQLLKWDKAAEKNGKVHRVFCASLADVFDNEAPQEWRDDLWLVIRESTWLDFLLVTKRVGNVPSMVPGYWVREHFPPNVRLLITVCNQEEADRDIPKLLALPCKNGISYEPALGPVDWSPWLGRQCDHGSVPGPHGVGGVMCPRCGGTRLADGCGGLEWIIVGGESSQPGHPARHFDVKWAYSTVQQCKAAGVPVFVKQLGSRPVSIHPGTGHKYDLDDPVQVEGAAFELQRIMDNSREYALKDRAGANPAEWPEDLRVREFP